jgi:sugar/nucleoside kinase (ribokinase family)
MHIACVGNAIVDSLLEFSSSDLQTYLQDGNLRLPLGAKILVSSSQVELGGNASNVSVGLSRLGYQSSLFAEIGDDLFGTYIQQTLASEQVDTRGMKKSGKTAMDVSLNGKQDRVIFVDHQPRENDFHPPFETIDGVYLTSMGNNWDAIYQRVVDARTQKDFVIACNPGSVQLKDVDTFITFLCHLSILVVNVEEAALLAKLDGKLEKGKDKEKTQAYIKEVFEKLFTYGPEIVVITDGIEGSYAAKKDDRKIYFCHTFDTPILEKTGAGDGFATGFLASYLKDSSIEEALISGTANGSSVVEYVGAQKGLLTKEKMEERKQLARRPLEVL